MIVYVDDLQDWGGRGFWKGKPSCHLLAVDLSPEAELALHELAQRIGMRRSWAQLPPKASWPHYDLVSSRRVAAVRAGAIEISSRAAAKLRRAIRRQLAETVGSGFS